MATSIDTISSADLKNTSPEVVLKEHHFVVECVGPTGAGKTTVCNFMAELLRQHGISVFSFKDVKQYFYQNKLRTLSIIIRTLFADGLTVIKFLALRARHGHMSADAVSRFMRLCIFHTAMREFSSKQKPHVLLLDQWSIQGLWSATIFAPSTAQLMTQLKRFFFPVDVLIYFDVDVQTSVSRIENRRHGASRFDSMPQDQRLEQLQRYNAYLYQLFEQAECRSKLTLSTLQSPEQCARRGVEFLKEAFQKNM